MAELLDTPIPSPEYEPTPEERRLIQRVEERISFSTRESSRWAIERQIFENISFFVGCQWLDYSETTRRLTRWQAPSWFPTPVTNLIAPRVGAMVANITRSRPQGRVRPTSNEPADREAARVAEQVLQHLYQVTREETIRTKAALIASLTGTVIAEDFFNPRAGQRLLVPRMQEREEPVMITGPDGMQMPKVWPTGQAVTQTVEDPELDDDGKPIIDEYREGEIETRVRPLFNFYWDPKATCLDEARWCGEAIYVDLDWVYENFPTLAPYVSSEEGIDAMNFYESSLLSLAGPSTQGAGAAATGGGGYFKHGVVLRKYQEKPSRNHPEGLHLITANGILLYRSGLPIRDHRGMITGEFTYTEFCYDEVPGRFAGRTAVDDLIPLQKRVNGIDAQLIINRKTLLNPWVLAPKGSGLEPGKIAMRPGATVLYNFIGVGASPTVVPGTPLPAQIMQEREAAILAMDQLVQDAAGAASQALPPGLKSGIALNFMRELQQEQLVPRLNRWGQWIALRDRKRLLLAQEHYREPRTVKLLGTGTDWQVKYWRGADLNGNTDVTVDSGTLMPKAQSVKTQMLFDGIEAGLVDPKDPTQRQRLIERLDLAEFETQVGPDQRRAKKENAQMDDGLPAMLTEFEDKELHLQEHIQRVKDPSFDALPAHVQEMHQRHIQETQQALQQEAEQAKQQAEEELSRRMALAERAQAVGVQLRDLENPQQMEPQLG